MVGSGKTVVQVMMGQHVHTFFATIFLSQAYGLHETWLGDEPPEAIQRILERLAESIAQTQEPDGSWHKESYGSLKTTALAWLALRSAHSAGITIKKAAADRTVKFLQEQFQPDSGLFRGGERTQSIYASVGALRVLYGMGSVKTDEVRKGTPAVLAMIKKINFLGYEGEDFLAAVMLTQSLIHEEGPFWGEWYPWIADTLVKKQNPDGSWTGLSCITGRTFPTACSLLSLGVPYKLLPLQEI